MATVTIDSHRQRMVDCLARGAGHEFLCLAEAYLDARPDDIEIRLNAVKEYLKLGLVCPARELLSNNGGDFSSVPDLEAIRDSLQHIRGSSTPWTRLAGTFQDNLVALASRGADTAIIENAWSTAQSDYELFHDTAAQPHVRRHDLYGRPRWVPFFGDHQSIDHARPLPDDIETLMPGPYLFEGVGTGWFLKRVYDASYRTFLDFSCALYVVEPDPAALAVLLHLHSWPDVWSDPRVFVFVGPHGVQSLDKTLSSNVNLAWPSWACTQREARLQGSPGCVDVIQSGIEARRIAVEESLNVIEGMYANRDTAYWARRFEEALSGHGVPLRILSTVSMHTTFLKHSMRDAKRAFEELGHQCEVLTENTTFEIISPLTYHQAIERLEPDLFFVVDHLRPEFGSIVPVDLPVMTWDQDMLPGVFVPERIQAMRPIDTIVGWPHRESLIRAQRDPGQSMFFHMPTSPPQFDTTDLTEEEMAPYRCDVSYVSHASQRAEDFHHEQYAVTKNATIRRVMDELYPIALASLPPGSREPRPHYLDMLALAEQRSGLSIQDETVREHLVQWYLWRLCDRLFRHQTLEWAARWARDRGRDFRIYGNGWEKHPTLAPFATGPLDNGRELSIVYRASAINLQLMPAGFIHQRALDGLAAGGFFLARAVRSDSRNPRLASLIRRIESLGLTSGSELLGCGDEDLLHDFLSCFSDRASRDAARADVTFRRLYEETERDYPHEVFPPFDEILFCDEASFTEKADYFTAHADRRAAVGATMRTVVVERYSYVKTMSRFLHFALDYYRSLRPS